MLPHGTAELAALAGQCVVTSFGTINGWEVDEWRMTPDDVDRAVDVYKAVLNASTTAQHPVFDRLARTGIDMTNLLAQCGQGLDLVTRSDIAEFAAAASVIATDGFNHQTMHMPNIPKMARRKSDSGVDVFDIKLHSAQSVASDTLMAGERLGLASVKHTTTLHASSLRQRIQRSISHQHELSPTYLAAQLRFVHGRLVAEGMAPDEATRTFLFMDDFPDPSRVGLYGVAVVDPGRRNDMVVQMKNLPTVHGGHKFRIISFPDLDRVQNRCP